MRLIINSCVALLIMTIGSCNAQVYNSNYTSISIASFSNEQFDLSKWLSIDTFNIKSNDCIVVVEKMEIISDSRFSYIESKTVKSNVTTSSSQNIERILIDNKDKIIYFLDSKVAFNCKAYEIEKDPSHSDSIYINKLEKDNRLGTIKFSTSVPKQVRGKLVASNSIDGVLEIITSNQKLILNGFTKVDNFNFKSIIEEAKEKCTLSEKQLDLIFPI